MQQRSLMQVELYVLDQAPQNLFKLIDDIMNCTQMILAL